MTDTEYSDEIIAAIREWQTPQVALTSWPAPGRWVDPGLQRMDPERAERLRSRLPATSGDTWQVARDLLAWAGAQWPHDGWNEGGGADALELLERAEAGENFRCVEFGILLTDALNAVGIPARRVALRCDGYQRPEPGMGHVAMEAWIDSLARWVLLDPQNSAWWELDGEPRNALELCRAHRAGVARPPFADFAGEDDAADLWWSYFDSASVGGTLLTFEPTAHITFQQLGFIACSRILTVDEHELAYPDLHHVDVATRVVEMSKDSGQQAVIEFMPTHPAVTNVRVDGVDLPSADATYELSTTAGAHRAEIEVVTRHGAFPAGCIEWTASDPEVSDYGPPVA